MSILVQKDVCEDKGDDNVKVLDKFLGVFFKLVKMFYRVLLVYVYSIKREKYADFITLGKRKIILLVIFKKSILLGHKRKNKK